MASEDGLREKVGRKLTKRRKEPKRVSMDIPDRFKDGDDAEEDVTAPRSKETMAMNQSLFSMITRAGGRSQADLRTLHDVDSGDSDEEGAGSPHYHSMDGAARLSRLSTIKTWDEAAEADDTLQKDTKHRRALSEHKLLKSLPRLNIKRRASKKGSPSDRMSSSQILPPRPTESEPTASAREDTLARRKGKANAKVLPDSEVQKLPAEPRRGRLGSTASSSKATGPVTLAQRLQQIFEFEALEEVISEYPCWLLQSILLQGYMYITQNHICFYAYIPKKHHDVSKTGYLSKRGRSKFNRYWFILKGDVLAYYTNPAELYFPRNRINLQYAVSASVTEAKDKTKDETYFSVLTDDRTYNFKADSAASAKEWVRSIQKVIFRTHNDGNSVKISLPTQNVLDIEESKLLDFADTVKIRVIDNDETFAIDDYFFSFFSHGQDALNVLRIMVNDNENHLDSPLSPDPQSALSTPARQSMDRHRTSTQMSALDAPPIRENVRATLSPLHADHLARSRSPRLSADSRRSSSDINRRSFDVRRSMDASRTFRRSSQEVRRSLSETRHNIHSPLRGGGSGDKSPLSGKPQDSSDSASNSLNHGTESSVAIQSIDESNASQILNRSDVFRGPTIHQQGASDPSISRQSQDTTRSISAGKTTQLFHQPDTRRGTTDIEEDNEGQQTAGRLSGSSSALQDFMGAASYPLQKASGFAGFIRTRSKKMSNLLATESMGYYEKVSGMWAGGRRHYNTVEGLNPEDQVREAEDEEDAVKAAEHFREHFALPETEQLQSSFFCHLQRMFPTYGKIYISNHYFCFRSLMIGSRTKLILPLRDIETVNKEKGFRLGLHGLVVVIRGHEELFFEFSRADFRDDCAVTLLRILESTRYMEDSSGPEDMDSDEEAAKAEHDMLQEARQKDYPEPPLEASQILRESEQGRIPLVFDDPLASIVDFKPAAPLRIVCLTIGSRGDVQPYIALCKGLMKEGHDCCIATHAEFEPWVRKHGIDFKPIDGNPAELMAICVEHGMFTHSFLREANSKFRGWLDDVCSSSWKACQGADLLIESPSTMAGIHVAEALEIPYFRAFTMPWTRTRAYPHAFLVSNHKLGGSYNSITYVSFDTVFWGAIRSQINLWRTKELGLKPTTLNRMQQNSRPFLYNFSPQVVSPPLDWPDWIRVTGYWFLDESDGYVPPQDLVDFMRKARKDKKKLVYVGFGSIVIDDPTALTKAVIDSILKADVRCILSKGWSNRLNGGDASKTEIPLPPEIFQIQSAPHDWLFKQIDAAVHHGGSGTTGASLRAGIPTIIKPFFGDQYFFGQRVQDLHVGIRLDKLNTSVLSRAIYHATTNLQLIIAAKRLGERIRKEDGVGVAIQTIYRELDRARSLVKKREHPAEGAAPAEVEDDWTWVGDEEEEVEIAPQQIAQWEGMQGLNHTPNPNAAQALGNLVLGGAGLAQGSAAVRRA